MGVIIIARFNHPVDCLPEDTVRYCRITVPMRCLAEEARGYIPRVCGQVGFGAYGDVPFYGKGTLWQRTCAVLKAIQRRKPYN